jgi:hypothetical protein
MNSSREGKKYELDVYNVVSKCTFNDKQFNNQTKDDLGGCKADNDIVCSIYKLDILYNIPIEIKKIRTPDWMQCSLSIDNTSNDNRWIGSIRNKIPDRSKKIFESLIQNIRLFDGNIPPFMTRDITHEEWKKIKNETNIYDDTYFDCPNDTIKRLYSEKGCYYIQISNKGLYHLGNDICDFNVPEFICDQRLRVRTKIHERKNTKGFCKLSITISCQPKNIKNLNDSPFSLDKINKLPKNLIYSI